MSDVYPFLMELLNNPYAWLFYVFLIVFLTLLAAYCLRIILDRLHAKTETTKTMFDDSLIHALQAPAYWLVWLMGISFAADILSKNSQADIHSITASVRAVGLVILIGWFLIRLIKAFEQKATDPKVRSEPLDKTTAFAIGKLLRATVIITAALIVMQELGYSVSGILAFGGIGGLAVGLAAKDMLANFFGGLTIYLDKPFKVGDWIRSPDKEIEGVVEDIGWRITRIRTFDKRPLYVQNSIFTQVSLENPSRMLNRRIYETIGIRYDDAPKMGKIVQEVKQMLLEHPDLDVEQILMVNFNTFAASSLDFFIYTLTKTTVWTEYHQIKQEILLSVFDIIERNGAECAFPTSTLHIASAKLDPAQFNTENGT
ncbi:MAG: MscS family membrane protein [Cellvibrionaceae bacterium]|jgi:MscS family membrane protein